MSQQITINHEHGIKAKRTIEKIVVHCSEELYLDIEETDDDGNVSTVETLLEKSKGAKIFAYDSSYINKLPDGFAQQAYELLTSE